MLTQQEQVGWLLPDGTLVSLAEPWPEPWNEEWVPVWRK